MFLSFVGIVVFSTNERVAWAKLYREPTLWNAGANEVCVGWLRLSPFLIASGGGLCKMYVTLLAEKQATAVGLLPEIVVIPLLLLYSTVSPADINSMFSCICKRSKKYAERLTYREAEKEFTTRYSCRNPAKAYLRKAEAERTVENDG